MKFTISFCLLLCLFQVGCAQQPETFDMLQFTGPKGWQKTVRNTAIEYSVTDKKTKEWCKIAVYNSAPGTGTLQGDFDLEWQELITKPLNPDTAPRLSEPQPGQSYSIQSGSAPFTFQGKQATAMLSIISGYGKRVSIVMIMNGESYMPAIDAFMQTVAVVPPPGAINLAGQERGTSLPAETTTAAANNHPAARAGTGTGSANAATEQPPAASGFHARFQYSRTNFDGGWSAVAQDDWVEATHGSIRVLIHYPSDKVDESSMDYKTIASNAWNAMVASRYKNLKNFYQLSNNISYTPGYYMHGSLTDARGGTKFVALFRKGRSNWVEIIAPDEASFVKEFIPATVDVYFSDWKPLQDLYNLNYFQVGANDLKGKWTNDFGRFMQYYNAYTGMAAATVTYSSIQTYTFQGSKYNWTIHSAGGQVGAMNFQSAKSAGTFKLDNWTMSCSDIENKPRTYPVSFRCIKNARLLVIDGQEYGLAKDQ